MHTDQVDAFDPIKSKPWTSAPAGLEGKFHPGAGTCGVSARGLGSPGVMSKGGGRD